PVEVIDELRAGWAEVGPIFDDEDRAQQAAFDATVQRVLDAAGVKPRPPRDDDRARDTGDEGRTGRRRRRDRPSAEQPAEAAPPSVRASEEHAVSQPPIEPAAVVAISPHDAVTRPVSAPAPSEEAEPGWDLGDEDPTAGTGPADKPEVSTPSSTEMAGDGAVEGDGLDTGWD